MHSILGGGTGKLEMLGFGPHLMLDGFHANPHKLTDAELLRQVLDELPAALEMTKILPPLVFNGSEDLDGYAGLTGVVLIAESHIAIHTFPEQDALVVDIFSCKDFDPQLAIKRLVDQFEIGRYTTYMINRGREIPKDLLLAQSIMAGEREYAETRIS